MSRLLRLLVLILLLPGPGPARAQEPLDEPLPVVLGPPQTNAVDLESLRERLVAASNLVSRSEMVRSNLIQTYLAAQSHLRSADTMRQRATASEQQAAEVPERLRELQGFLATPPTNPIPRVSVDAPVAELEQAVAEVGSELDLARAQKETLDAEPKRRSDRSYQITELQSLARERLKELETQLQTPLAAQDALPIAERFKSLAQRDLIRAEMQAYTRELDEYKATGELLVLRQALATRRIAQLEKEQDLLKNALTRQRQLEASRAVARASDARREAEILNIPLVQGLARTNQQLAQLRADLSERVNRSSRQLDAAQAELSQLRSKFHEVQSRVDTVSRSGLSRNYAIGLALRRTEYALPGPQRYQTESVGRMDELSQIQLDQLLMYDQRKEVADVEAFLDDLRFDLMSQVPEGELEAILNRSRELITQQRDLLGQLLLEYSQYVENLIKLSDVEEELSEEVRRFRAYIDERVLWIRSTDLLTPAAASEEARILWSVLAARENLRPFSYLAQDARQNAGRYLVMIGLLVLLWVARPALRRGLQRDADRETARRAAEFGPSLRALGRTLLLVAPFPLLMLFLGARLRVPYMDMVLAERVPYTFTALGWSLSMGLLLFYVCHPGGLAEAHFRWPSHDTGLLRRNIRWMIVLALPLGFFIYLLEGVFVENLSNRLLFIPSMIIGTVFFHRVLRPEHGLHYTSAPSKPALWQRLVHVVSLVIPLALALAAAFGYTFTARKFWLCVVPSIWLVFLVILTRSLVLHWILILQRHMLIQRLQEKRRAQVQAAAQAQAAGTDPPPSTVDVEPDPVLESKDVHSQAQSLVNLGFVIVLAAALFGVWKPVFPAFGFLDDVKLWRTEVTLPGEAERPLRILPQSGETASADAPVASVTTSVRTWEWITLADVGWAFLIGLLTLIVSRNLPGFLHILVLSRLQISRGEAYAITTVARYVLVLIGVIMATQAIGITWGKIQWLAAAVTVGIGFGLQEIFANFVSGLIILFERPVRLGDTVTVGDVSGVVSRIQIRATTLRDWDEKELILPNREFITNRFINWSLSDTIVRLICKVGVSYSADVRKVNDLLLQIAADEPRLLKHPPPSVLFLNFGESSLDFELRAFVDSPDIRLSVRHRLNMRIVEAFREAGIEIAFPQRDLHVRSLPEGFPGTSEPPGAAK